jgi:hypothetical protein
MFNARCELNLYVSLRLRFTSQAMPCLRRLVAGVSSLQPDFSPRSVFVRFVAGNGAGFSPSVSVFTGQHNFTNAP